MKQLPRSLERGLIVSAVLALVLAGAASAGFLEEQKLLEARTLIYQGRYSEGLVILQEVLSEHPDSRDALFLLATAHEWQGELEEALRVYRTIVSVHEDDIEAWEQVAKLEGWRANYEGAISLYGTLISRFGERPSLLIGLARTLSWSNRPGEALQHYERVLLQQPNNVEALAGKAQILRWVGELHEARRLIRQAESLDPSHPEVERESREIEIALSPRISTSYSESLERDYLRSRDMYYYNLGKRTGRAKAEFRLETIEKLTFDLWTSRDWEVDKTLEKENFRISSVGFATALAIEVVGPVRAGGDLRVVRYKDASENVLFPILSDEEREENFELWLSGEYGTWDVNLGVGTYPVFVKKTREFPFLNSLEIGEQTVSRFSLGKRFWDGLKGSLGWEVASYTDGNDRKKAYGSVEVTPEGLPWVTLRYTLHYQDFGETSRNYFTPLEELSQRFQLNMRRPRGKDFSGAGLMLGASNSENFGSIFSVGLSGSVSRFVTDTLRLRGSGFLSYDDNRYFVHGVEIGIELRL